MLSNTISNNIKRLNSMLTQLLIKASEIDKLNARSKIHQLIENNNLFSSSLFSTQSDTFYPYVKEVERKVKEYENIACNTQNTNELLIQQLRTELLQNIEQQISSIINALQANTAMHQAAKRSQDAKNKARYKLKQHQYSQLVKKVVLTSHQLYEKLTEHHEFERRLLAMIFEKEQALARSKAKNQNILSTEVLTLHQRLGRCRQAISGIEKEIELSEKRN